MGIMIEYLLDCSNYIINRGIFCRDKWMKTIEFITGTLVFTVVYFGIQIVVAYFGGYL